MVARNLIKYPSLPYPTKFILASVVFISLYINPSLSDPFNSPKLWALMILGSWLLGHNIFFIFMRRNELIKVEKFFLLILFLFILSMFGSSLMTKVSFTAFFGEQQRRLGFLFYLYMGIFMVAAALFYSVKNLSILYRGAIALGIVFAGYGSLQAMGRDFISWNNPYNSIILTLGNPNFASALMSILVVIVFSYIESAKKIYKIPLIVLGVYILYLITLSESRQGIIAFGIGAMVVILTRVFWVSKRLGLVLSCTFFSLFVLVILAMLQTGPLAQIIYKNSVSLRGFYWRAGIEMFQSNIVTGVGVDSYGDYFRQFRERAYPLTYGYQIGSDNAHNVPIQMFATGGIFTGILYLSLTIFIASIAIKLLALKDSRENRLALGLFGAWITFQAQSIISIDNVGLTIWGWVLGGTLVGIYSSTVKNGPNNSLVKLVKVSETDAIKQKLFSSFLTFFAIVLCSILYQGEKYLYQITSYLNNTSVNQFNEFELAANKFENAKLVEPAYKFRYANILFQINRIDKSKNIVESLLITNPNSFDYHNGCAELYTLESNWQKVISCRIKLSKIDPWNAENYLKLGLAYEMLGDNKSAAINYERIISFASDKPEGLKARESLDKIKNQ